MPSKQRVQRMCVAISAATRRRQTQQDAEALAAGLNRLSIGWANYFRLGLVSKAYRAVEQHACGRLLTVAVWQDKVHGRGFGRFPDLHLHNVLGLVRLSSRASSFP